jgi:hypothetical protein
MPKAVNDAMARNTSPAKKAEVEVEETSDRTISRPDRAKMTGAKNF